MSDELKSLTSEQLETEVKERYKSAKDALDKLNSAGLNRRVSDIESNNGLGQGWIKTISNMTATGLVGLLLFLAQNEGFKILRGLMEESKEQRRGFAESLDSIRGEREKDRQNILKHSDEATNAMREIARGLRDLGQRHKDNEDLNDELQGLIKPEIKPDEAKRGPNS